LSGIVDTTLSVWRQLPLPLRRRVSTWRQRAVGNYASLVAAVIKTAPVGARAIISERIGNELSVVQPLDYDGGAIRIHVDSLIELTTRVRSCAKEPETVRWIETYVRPGEVVFDIGANVGAYSFVIDRHSGGNARVYAFEPGAATFLQLTRNIALNRCEGRVIPIGIGFGASTRLATFNYSSIVPGAARHSLDAAIDLEGQPFQPAMSQPVMLYSIDDFIDSFGIENPAHMKIDVDGPELDILKGATRTMADRRLRTIMIELEPTSPASTEATTLLEAAGFALTSVSSHGSATETSNYLFVRESQ